MKYQLIGSARSPFARICRMLMLQNGIDFEFRVLNFVDDRAAAAELAKETPINKVPVLIIGGEQRLFDSRVIVNYLTETHGLSKLTLDEQNYVSAAYSLMDVSVIFFLMARDGLDVNGPGHYLRRQRSRIPANLEFLRPWVGQLDPARHWNYASMSVYAYAYWACRRDLLRIDEYPWLKDYLSKFAEAPGVTETSF